MARVRRVSVGLSFFVVLASAQTNPPAQEPGVVSAGTGNPYQRAGQLPARIMDFKAEPASIQPGQKTTLSWSTENPTGVSIDPDPGRVTPRGVLQVSPSRTTTYTLTVRGPNNQVLTKELTVNVAGTTPISAEASPSAKKEAPRTSAGHPDFSGVYDYRGAGGRGGRGAAGRGGNATAAATAATSAPAGPELKPGAEKYRVVRPAEDTGQYSDCMPLAGPQTFAVPYQFELVESSHHLAILTGYPGTFRSIPTDGGPHPADPDPTWMGDSIGHWEGDTLVIDSVGFNDKTEISGYKHTDALHIVEKFSRQEDNTLRYEATVDDPNVFVRPWTLTGTFTLRPDLSKVDEFVCEHNIDYNKYFEKK